MCQADRETLLDAFLDYVADQDGQLVIIGDLFELLRYRLDRIIARRGRLLDRLARMETIYVPGNHDEDAVRWMTASDVPHPFFARMSQAFTRDIGQKRFKFLHGHEVDPFINAPIQHIGRVIGSVAHLLEYRHGACILSNDAVTDALLEAGEHVLQLWRKLTGGVNQVIVDCCGMMPAENVTRLLRSHRTRHMLERYHADKAEGLYDVAIVGHTHKAGTVGGWYYNSGSWTARTNNFLRIAPGGTVDVFDWGRRGPRISRSVVTT